MSSSQTNNIVVLQPELSFPKEYTYIVEKGAINSTWTPQISSNYSNNQISFSVNMPSREVLLDRYMGCEVKFRISVTGTAPADGSDLITPDKGIWAPRSFPLNKIIQSVKMSMGGFSSNSAAPYQIMDAVQWLRMWNEDTQLWHSTTPSLADNCQKYSDMHLHSSNVLNPAGNGDYWQDPRGAFFVKISPGSSGSLKTSAYLDFTVVEPLLIPSLPFSPKERVVALGGVDNIQFTLQLGNLQRILSYDVDNGHALSSVDVSITDNPILHCRFLTAPSMDILPATKLYSNNIIDVYETLGGANSKTQGAEFTINSNNMILNYIPDNILIFAKRKLSDIADSDSYKYSDCFAEITGLSINFDNRSGILGSASGTDIWQISAENGCKLSWGQWHGMGQTTDGYAEKAVGSVAVLKPYKDFGLASDLASGVYNVQRNFQVKATFKNLSSDTIDYTLFIVTITDSILQVHEGQVSEQTGVITQEQLAKAPISDVSPTLLKNVYGGNIFGDIKKFIGKHKGPIGSVLDVASSVGSKLLPGFKGEIAATRKAVKDITGLGGGLISKSDRDKLTKIIGHKSKLTTKKI